MPSHADRVRRHYGRCRSSRRAALDAASRSGGRAWERAFRGATRDDCRSASLNARFRRVTTVRRVWSANTTSGLSVGPGMNTY